ncbi:MAG: hypothetical protein NT159_17905 [Proteobacteria bacterium]|nr:hypothetical protein [Pseudomonadota bacterium]
MDRWGIDDSLPAASLNDSTITSAIREPLGSNPWGSVPPPTADTPNHCYKAVLWFRAANDDNYGIRLDPLAPFIVCTTSHSTFAGGVPDGYKAGMGNLTLEEVASIPKTFKQPKIRQTFLNGRFMVFSARQEIAPVAWRGVVPSRQLRIALAILLILRTEAIPVI